MRKGCLATGVPLPCRAVLSAATLACAAFATTANAQQASSTVAPNGQHQAASTEAPSVTASVGEVIVTAERRSERLENVPVAVASVSAAQVQNAHIETTYDLSSVTPGLTSYQATGFVMPHLRGIGNTVDSVGIENPVAIYVDGVYYANMSGSLFSLNNIERVEVDMGPQGTLFGRNASGGVIQIITRDPQHESSGNAQLGYGNYNTINGSLYVTGGLSDTLAADLAVYFNDRTSGYGVNVHNGQPVGRQKDLSLRTKWLWTPTSRDEIRLSADYADSTGSAYVMNRYTNGTTPLGAPPFALSNPWDVDSQAQPFGWVTQWGVSLDARHDFGFAQLVDIAAYRRTIADSDFTFSLFPFDIGGNIAQKYSQVSEEVQLLSEADSKIKWVAGFFYMNAPAQSDPFNLTGSFLPVIAGAPANPITWNTVSDQSEAAFGQATFPLPLQTNLTVGARYTWEARGISGDVGLIGIPSSFANVSSSRSYAAPTWRVSVDHHFSDEVMGYVSASTGYRAGTYNGSGTSVAGLETAVLPEHLTAYEVGLKNDLFHGRFTLNVAGFYYDYSNIQVPIYTATGVTVLSGPRATLYGADLDANLEVTDRLTLSGGLALLHSDFVSFPSAPFFANAPSGAGIVGFGASADGKELPVAPPVTFNLSAVYKLPLEGGASLTFAGNYAYEDRWFSGPDNGLAAPPSNLLNGTVTWSSPGDRYELEFWGRNLLNEQIVARLSEIAPWGDIETLAPPLTFGGAVRVKW